MNQMLVAVTTSKCNASRQLEDVHWGLKNCNSSAMYGKQMKHLKRELCIAHGALKKWGSGAYLCKQVKCVVRELSSYTAWWIRGAEVPVIASIWHAQRGSFRTHATVQLIWGNGTNLSKQFGHLKKELHVVHSRCSCTFFMSSTSLPFLWCTCSLLVSWAWQINSVPCSEALILGNIHRLAT
jgi:hypothetical protein